MAGAPSAPVWESVREISTGNVPSVPGFRTPVFEIVERGIGIGVNP